MIYPILKTGYNNYAFESWLALRHPKNHNIKPKIRQQLQFLRDKGFVEFLGDGRYKKSI